MHSKKIPWEKNDLLSSSAPPPRRWRSPVPEGAGRDLLWGQTAAVGCWGKFDRYGCLGNFRMLLGCLKLKIQRSIRFDFKDQIPQVYDIYLEYLVQRKRTQDVPFWVPSPNKCHFEQSTHKAPTTSPACCLQAEASEPQGWQLQLRQQGVRRPAGCATIVGDGGQGARQLDRNHLVKIKHRLATVAHCEQKSSQMFLQDDVGVNISSPKKIRINWSTLKNIQVAESIVANRTISQGPPGRWLASLPAGWKTLAALPAPRAVDFSRASNIKNRSKYTGQYRSSFLAWPQLTYISIINHKWSSRVLLRPFHKAKQVLFCGKWEHALILVQTKYLTSPSSLSKLVQKDSKGHFLNRCCSKIDQWVFSKDQKVLGKVFSADQNWSCFSNYCKNWLEIVCDK